MEIFFTASQRGKKYFFSYYKRIYRAFEELGFTHLDNEIVKTPSEDAFSKLDKNGIKAYQAFYRKGLNNLKKAYINVFECSLPSLSVGFMINKSLDYNKPTIALYLDNNVPYFLEGIQDEEKLLIANYSDKNIEKVIQKTVKLAKKSTDKRFNFFISPELLNYLKEASKKEGVTKSTFIRNIIKEHKNRSENNQKYT